MKKFLKAIVLVLIIAVLFPETSVYAADYYFVHPYTVSCSAGSNVRDVRALYASYEGNTFVNLTDVSALLNGTQKQFSITYEYTESDGNLFYVKTGAASRDLSVHYDNPGSIYMELYRNRIFVNNSERRYYTFRLGTELYMSLVDVQLMLDLSCSYNEDGSIAFDTDGFSVDLEELENSGYFDYNTGIVLGDAETGEILYSKDRYRETSIASTSKLMTYLLTMEAVDDGIISADDVVTISQRVAELSVTEDGAIEMAKGMEVPLYDLLEGLLLASSNECAEAIAEHVSGTVEDFVVKMNERAAELGLTSAKFYNPHGLPLYTDSTISAKLQNVMNANDMFVLASYILENYPQITDITSMVYCTISSLNYTTANSNPLVFNMEGVNGLKTGSTVRAGSCVVASMPVTVNNETHNIVLVIFGAESGMERGQAAEILLRYARQYYLSEGFASAA